MTETVRPWQPSFLGLTLDPERGGVSALEAAARATLAALDRDGLLRDEHAVTCQLVLELCRAVAAGVRSGRASAVALAARELREAIATLPVPEVAPSDEWREFVHALRTPGAEL